METDTIESDENLTWLFEQLLTNYMPNQNQHLRQAACFWLLALVKKAANKSSILSGNNLFRVQDAFIQRLGETDEITQEVASKAIGVLFSLANAEQKKILVDRLTDTISGGMRRKVVNPNEEIFQPEQIGKTPEGGNITTYKELCSLANDLNKPDLVYQFMNLAHHNSIWNSRRGAAFGLGAISQLSSDQLQPYLAKIVPKLFRYQFDPNPRIQQSMSSIWDELTKSDKKIIDLHLLEILADIEAHMLDPTWRVRESCCLALCDILKGKPLIYEFSPHLKSSQIIRVFK